MSKDTKAPEQDVIIEGHDYDGILEYDNPMPRWWLAIFALTVVWSVYYVIAIEVGWINTYEKDLAAESVHIDALQEAWAASQIPVDEEYLRSKLEDPVFLAAGQAAFVGYCAACHQDSGAGLIGPNMTDDYWIHGGELMDLYNVANEGVLDKGMPAWGPLLSHEELVGTVVYIRSLRGTNPPNAKEAEGELWVEQAADVVVDAPAEDDAAALEGEAPSEEAGDLPADDAPTPDAPEDQAPGEEE